MTERTVPLLPCRDIDDIAPFYAALGFTQTYRQVRPSPYLCLRRGPIDLHFFSVEGFDPEDSMGTAALAAIRTLDLGPPDRARYADELPAVAELETNR